ncbi:MAG: hypothetical protein FD145_616 [Candidatus Saganbacteria bacterium]|uniref:Uncharacterized protein n=1 Tax=Candidatus Saganbacteria bacterium TaxID=2575572 RepID=A0A833NYU3_UNCSA|nr:MAG: hypothetical protein FD145_616 [Candidatus Saganbacteria bacterium]
MKKEHFEVLLEEIRGDVKLALEGHQVLNRKIDEMKDELKVDFDGLKVELRNVGRNLGKKI